jgi:hypothetical protein
VRPIVSGTVAQYFDFIITPDFGGGTTVLQDAYIDVRYTPKLRVRAPSWPGATRASRSVVASKP